MQVSLDKNIKEFNTLMLNKNYIELPSDIFTPNSVIKETKKLYENKIENGIPLRWNNFCIDKSIKRYFFTLSKGEITLVGGIPSAGKSIFMFDIISQTICKNDWRWCIFSPETGAPHKIHRKLVENIVGKTYHGKWGTKKIDWNEIEETSNLLQSKAYYLYPKTSVSEYILKQIEFIHKEFDIDAFVLDPLNCIKLSNYGEKDDSNISLFLADIKKLCEEYNLHCFLVAHPTKEGIIDRETGAERPPNPAHTKGAIELYSKPDNILIIHRQKDLEKNPRREVEIYIKKIRNQDIGIGELGRVILYYNITTGRLEDQFVNNLFIQKYKY